MLQLDGWELKLLAHLDQWEINQLGLDKWGFDQRGLDKLCNLANGNQNCFCSWTNQDWTNGAAGLMEIELPSAIAAEVMGT